MYKIYIITGEVFFIHHIGETFYSHIVMKNFWLLPIYGQMQVVEDAVPFLNHPISFASSFATATAPEGAYDLKQQK